jgi:hypothetical protein
MIHSWKITGLLTALFFLPFLSLPQATQIKSEPEVTNAAISAALALGNAGNLSDYFNSMVDLGLAGNEDTYSKAQATQILKDFFSKNPVRSFKVTRQGTSTDGSRFTIGEMKTATETLRVYYLLKKVTGKYLIQQL